MNCWGDRYSGSVVALVSPTRPPDHRPSCSFTIYPAGTADALEGQGTSVGRLCDAVKALLLPCGQSSQQQALSLRSRSRWMALLGRQIIPEPWWWKCWMADNFLSYYKTIGNQKRTCLNRYQSCSNTSWFSGGRERQNRSNDDSASIQPKVYLYLQKLQTRP